jgi:hypothetical protein
VTIRLVCIVLLFMAPAVPQVILSGGCLPNQAPTCDVDYFATFGAIGCDCGGICTNGNTVRARAIVVWGCPEPQYAHTTGWSEPGRPEATAFGEIFGPGHPGYENYQEWNNCNGAYYNVGGISGVC